MWSGRGRAGALVVAALVSGGCRLDMHEQPRYESYESSGFFADGMAMRPVPPQTVPSVGEDDRPLAYAAKSRLDPHAPRLSKPASVGQSVPADVATATTAPLPITRELLDRGHDLYDTFCAACHGLTGEGDGMVARRGYRQPPSYHEPRLRQAPIGHFVDVITNGWGAMPTYDYLVAPNDRWAVAAYIRALQLSRAMPVEAMPESLRSTMSAPQEQTR